jgi:hypothetical protein
MAAPNIAFGWIVSPMFPVLGSCGTLGLAAITGG